MRLARVGALTDRDRAAILDFWIRGWRAVFPDIDFAAQRAWLSAHLDCLMADGAALIVTRATDTGEPTGFVTVHPGTGTMDQLAVNPDHQGSGLGRALLDAAKHLSPAGLHLRVNKANPRAVDLYARAGFVVTGEDISVRSGLPIWTMAWRPAAGADAPSL